MNKLFLTSKKHASNPVKGQAAIDSAVDRAAVECNLFPEAIELLGSLGVLKRIFGAYAEKHSDRFTQAFVNRIERHCQNMNPTTQQFVTGILSDFGEYLLCQDPETERFQFDPKALSLLRRLYAAPNQRDFLQQISSIQVLCAEIT